jgi:starch synthase
MGDYYDNLERFTFFCYVALKVTRAISFRPDVIHCHDWQTGLVPALLRGLPRQTAFLRDIPTVFTIHNLGYQGLFPAEELPLTGLPKERFFHPKGIEYWGKISLLKAGIVYSEAITTVSPTYAREIQTPEFGLGMEGVLHDRKAHLHGILNGADYRLWDPAHDPHLPVQYSLREIEGKQHCKEALIKEMGLDLSLKDRPLLGMVSRLDSQKGLDLLTTAFDEILSLDCLLVVLGSGDERIQKALQGGARRYPGRVNVKIGFDEALAHRITAGADIFLIPSRYEPCGLTQLYALKYGTVPVVRSTGGLEDTIAAFDPRTGQGNGFKFSPYKADAFIESVTEAVQCYRKPKKWRTIRANGIKADFSWERSARTYQALYEAVIAGSVGAH